MTATDVSTLKLPEGVISHLRATDRSDVLAQRIGVDFDWWNERLDRYGVPGAPIGSADGRG